MPLLFLNDNEEWRGLLVDFDWSRHVGVLKYPPGLRLNTSGENKWANGVEPVAENRSMIWICLKRSSMVRMSKYSQVRDKVS